MNVIEGTAEGVTLDIKRMFIPGVFLKSDCPTCNQTITKDFEKEYFSYPRVGVPTEFYFLCESDKEKGGYCNTEWVVKVTLQISLTLVEEGSP